MTIVRLTCPECDKVFKANGEPPPGKKVKCPACKHAFVPAQDDDNEEESENEEKPRGKAKTATKKTDDDRPKKRRRDEEDDDEDDEDDGDEEDEDEDDVPAKKKKKKKKSGGTSALYWVYRGATVVLLLVLMGVLAWILLIRPSKVNIDVVVELTPADVQYRSYEPTSKSQEVNVSAQAISGQFDIYVFLEKDKAEVEAAIIARKKTAKILGSRPNTKDFDQKVSVPPNENAMVRLSSADGKKGEVKLKMSN
jgi:predicted Zn finger-like uncharacterized protein